MSLKLLIGQIRESVNNLTRDTRNLETTTDQLNTLLGKEGTLEQAPSLPSPNLEHYKVFRNYCEHEDALINNRLSWNTTIQSFLFVIYALLIKDQDKFITGWGLPILGSSIAVASWIGVLAASKALQKLNEDWEKIIDGRPEKSLLPASLLGGGDKWAHRLGLIAPSLHPVIIVGAWTLLLPLGIIWRIVILIFEVCALIFLFRGFLFRALKKTNIRS